MATPAGDHGLDLRLMRILDVLLDECSVSKTATILGQSQPSVSLALKRLREILGDPLLVRSGVKLIPTEKGIALRAHVSNILREIDALAVSEDTFDPASYNRRFRVYAANCLGTFFMPRIGELVRREAPNMPLDFCAIPEESRIFTELEEGKLDLVIGNWPMPRDYLRFAPLLETDIVLVMRNEHPLAGRSRIDLQEYLSLDHLSPTPHTSPAISPIDGQLAQLDAKREIAMSVAEFTLVPHMLARTNLVFTSSRPFAEQMAQSGAFSIVGAPEELARMSFYTLWHERSHLSPGNQWFRRLLRRVAKQISEFTPLPSSETSPEAISGNQ
ncbi:MULTISPECIES: LysR family transcriptional regulator [unclassified Martelella]|uniref:LysR family transcriptional regulator n=1 Tax=unclassified Martelella TaxID=2629616 RepID=UPI0025BE3181|nr:LysR family transcriptional regulator [Martelella sp.]